MRTAWAKVRRSLGGSHGILRPGKALVIGMLVAVTGLLLQAGSGPIPVHANGGSGSRTVLSEQTGPYYLVVIAEPGRPRVGSVHLTFVLMDGERTASIRDAAIAIKVTPPPDSGLETISYPVSQSQSNPDNYDVTLPVEVVGDWGIEASVEGALGRAETSLALSVTARDSAIFTILIVTLAFPAFLIVLWVWLRWRRSRQPTDA